MEKKDCLCLKCGERFKCDFALSMWAAKARMIRAAIKVSAITIKCSLFWDETLISRLGVGERFD